MVVPGERADAVLVVLYRLHELHFWDVPDVYCSLAVAHSQHIAGRAPLQGGILGLEVFGGDDFVALDHLTHLARVRVPQLDGVAQGHRDEVLVAPVEDIYVVVIPEARGVEHLGRGRADLALALHAVLLQVVEGRNGAHIPPAHRLRFANGSSEPQEIIFALGLGVEQVLAHRTAPALLCGGPKLLVLGAAGRLQLQHLLLQHGVVEQDILLILLADFGLPVFALLGRRAQRAQIEEVAREVVRAAGDEAVALDLAVWTVLGAELAHAVLDLPLGPVLAVGAEGHGARLAVRRAEEVEVQLLAGLVGRARGRVRRKTRGFHLSQLQIRSDF